MNSELNSDLPFTQSNLVRKCRVQAVIFVGLIPHTIREVDLLLCINDLIGFSGPFNSVEDSAFMYCQSVL